MTNSNPRITKRDRFNELRTLAEVNGKSDLVAFIDHELDLLAKKNSGEKKPTATQVANEGIKDTIVAVLSDGTPRTIGEICKADASLSELSSQRVSALVKQLRDGGIVKREEIKRKAYFSLV